MELGTAMKAKRRGKRGKSQRCHVKEVRVKGRGTRYMLICPHKRAKFVSKARAKAYRR